MESEKVGPRQAVYDTVRLVLPTPDRSLDRIVSGLESVKKQIDLDTGAERFAGVTREGMSRFPSGERRNAARLA